MIHFISVANKSFWGIGDNNKYLNGMASFLRTTTNGGFSIKFLYVTVGGGDRPPPPGGGGGRVGWVGGWVGRWVGGWVAQPWPRPKLPPPPGVTKQWAARYALGICFLSLCADL